MLNKLCHWIVFNIFQLDPAHGFGEMVCFFIYDTVKIIVLLFFMISFIGILRTFMPENKVKKWLSEKKAMGNIFAALFGSLTPFCSCSSIPIFLGFVKSGIPLGVTFSFLITSPLINEYLVVLMLGFFGWKITVLYVLSGLLIGIVSGIIIGKMHLEKYIVADIISSDNDDQAVQYNSFKQRLNFGIKEAVSIIKKLWLWIIFGVGIGAIIHNYVPQEAIQEIIGKAGIFSVPIAVILGVPMYGSCAAIVPIAVVLFKKGIPLGTALAFMMAVAALSLPEGVLLRRAMRLQLILIFFLITTLGIIFTGYFFNAIQNLIVFY